MKSLFKRKSLTFLWIAVFLVGGFFVSTGLAAASDSTSTVGDLGALKAALNDSNIKTINISAGTYELTEQLNIDRPVSINGQGLVTLKTSNTLWSSVDGYKHLVLIESGTQSNPVSISNITLDSSNTSGLNTYNNAYGILNGVTIKNSKGAGLTVNGSTIDATGLNISGSNWGSINIDPGFGVLTPSVLVLKNSDLSDALKIWSDGKNVTNVATIAVNADDYILKEGSTGKYWVKTIIKTVNDENSLKAALSDSSVSTIIIGNDFPVSQQIVISRPVTIDGDNKIISKNTGVDSKTWQSGNAYIFQVYKTEGVIIKDIILTGGNAALFINNSEATLSGKIDVSDNGFGGIESSYGSVLTIASDANLVNSSEAYGNPTLWEDGIVGGTVSGFNGTINKTIKPTQIQYYLKPD